MIAFPNPVADLTDSDRLNAAFVFLLPRIERNARLRFRHLRCSNQREDAVAETVALAWPSPRSTHSPPDVRTPPPS